MRLFLDDIRDPYKVTYRTMPLGPWKVVRNYDAFCNTINDHFQKTGKLPEFISFDHDLAQEHYSENMMDAVAYNEMYKTFNEKTGFDCAKWLVEFCLDNDLKMCDFQVHSLNPVGGTNIERLLLSFRKHQSENE
jgi:hypothetical protein